jgi:curved DNA-binding protein CbpA
VSAPWAGRTPLEDACEVLGVSASAPRVVVDAAYRVRAAETHPDKNPRAPGAAAIAFRRIGDARDTIYKARGWKK